MSVCISAYQQPASMYPVLDPRRTAGRGPWQYGYLFAFDAVRIDVNRDPSLMSCQMKISISSSLTSDKQVQAWNAFLNNTVGVIGTTSGLATSMTISKALGPPSCVTGTDTVVLCKRGWYNAMTPMYSFYPWDFWDYWGGCDVTFNWLFDDGGSGSWGDKVPPPTYPLVSAPDGTLMVEPGPPQKFNVVFGGASFPINDPADLPLLGLDPNNALSGSLGPFPADFTLVRELSSHRGPMPNWNIDVFVVYGGAKFLISDRWTLAGLGLDFGKVHVIPSGGTKQLGTMPFDGTLLKEQHDPRIFVVINQMLSLISSASLGQLCLPARHLRTVPDKALSSLPRGPDL